MPTEETPAAEPTPLVAEADNTPVAETFEAVEEPEVEAVKEEAELHETTEAVEVVETPAADNIAATESPATEAEAAIPVEAEAVPDVQVEVATPASETPSFTEDGDIEPDSPLEQRLVEAAGLVYEPATQPLPAMDVAAPEQTRVTEPAEESVPTPTVPSSDDLADAEGMPEALKAAGAAEVWLW